MNTQVKKKPNSLRNIRTHTPSVLVGQTEKIESTPVVLNADTPRVKTVKNSTGAPKTMGRPKKKAGQKENNKIQLSFNDAEMAELEEKAGRVPLATFLKGYLKDSNFME